VAHDDFAIRDAGLTAREEAVAKATQEGNCIDEVVFKNGLKELNPDLHFDLGGAHDIWHPGISERQGVFLNGRHICSMDRGSLPEFSIYDMKLAAIEVPISDIHPSEVAVPISLNGDTAYVRRPVKNRTLRVGWRHTVERLIQRRVPGITRKAVSEKFNVPMLYFGGKTNELEVS